MKKTVAITLTPELLEKIDKDRKSLSLGSVPRSQWIEGILRKYYSESSSDLIR